MVKFFVIATLILLNGIIFYAYKCKGEEGYEETLKGICGIFVIYLIVSLLMITYKSEIKNIVRPSRNENTISVEKTEAKRDEPVKNETVIGVVLRKSIWVKLEDLDEFVAALKREDVAYLDRMIYEGRAFVVRMDARVMRSESGIYTGVVFITFLEGEYTNQQGYTIKKCVPTEEEYFANEGKMYIPNSNR